MIYVFISQRHLHKIRGKDKSQIDLEDREKGFSLYLNGANNSSVRAKTAIEQKRRSKTAGDFETECNIKVHNVINFADPCKKDKLDMCTSRYGIHVHVHYTYTVYTALIV